MLTIAGIAFIATLQFYKTAKSKGIHPGKAASIPFILAGIWFAIAYLAAKLFGYAGNPFGVSDSTIERIVWMADVFLTLTYLCAISKYWKMITGLKPRQ